MQHRGIDYVNKLREDKTLDDAGVMKRIMSERDALLSLLHRVEPRLREDKHIETYHMLEVASVYQQLGDPDHPSAQKKLRAAIDGTTPSGDPLTSTQLKREKAAALTPEKDGPENRSRFPVSTRHVAGG